MVPPLPVPTPEAFNPPETNMLPVPVIASGGAGTMEHFSDVFVNANADAALAASIFHYKEIAIPELKQYLKQENVIVRL